MKKLFLPILLMVTVSAHAAENPVLTIEGGQVQGVLANGPKGGVWAPCTAQNPKFMVFKLNDKDVEASVFGEPEIAPRPQGFPGLR